MESPMRRAAILTQLLLLLYFELAMLVPLGAWNDQPAMHAPFSLGRAIMPTAIGLGQILLLWATIARMRWLMWVGITADLAWFSAQAYSLWQPYLFGASEERMQMQLRVFGHTTHWLPTFGNHPAPDAMHIVIQMLLVAVLATTIAFACRSRSKRKTHGQAEGFAANN
jgi:hypothetical protein